MDDPLSCCINHSSLKYLPRNNLAIRLLAWAVVVVMARIVTAQAKANLELQGHKVKGPFLTSTSL